MIARTLRAFLCLHEKNIAFLLRNKNTVAIVRPSVKENGEYKMTTIQRITFKGSQRPIKGATAAPLRSVELVGIEPLTNAQRLENFKQRLECGWIVGKARKVMEQAS